MIEPNAGCHDERIVYKFTDTNLRTHEEYQYRKGVWAMPPGGIDPAAPLCTEHWLHVYEGPELAVLMAPLNLAAKQERLWRATARGPYRDNHGIQLGVGALQLDEEIAIPQCNIGQRREFAMVCALFVCHDPAWVWWAERWLRGAHLPPISLMRLVPGLHTSGVRQYGPAYGAVYAAVHADTYDADADVYAADAAAYAADAGLPARLAEIARDILTGRRPQK